ncbi:DUF6216 family protein [Rouxiella sp. T17]|uniref:DUF6216 family protein n=1 Tax=Rouxiella sp. T17 TaxID=3085684 RepID=UPI002FC78597
MDFESLIGYVGKFDVLINTITTIIIVSFLAFYFYKRSGSSYSIINRIWSIFFSHKEFHNHSLKTNLLDRLDIDKYNALFNVKAINIKQIHAFNDWLEKYNINVKLISKIKGWFDIQELQTISPNNKETAFLFASILPVLLVGVFSLAIGTSDQAIVKTDSDNVWIAISPKHIKPLFSHEVITPSLCDKPNLDYSYYQKNTGLTPASLKILCNSFTDSEDQSSIARIIHSQRPLIIFGLIFITFSLKIYRAIMRRINVSTAEKHIKESYEIYQRKAQQ